MKIVRAPDRIRRAVRAARAEGGLVGFVPTMGYLHEGHLSLARRARRECDLVVASIFVNPLQFGPKEDFAAYPRAPRRDRDMLRSEGVDLCYEPTAGGMYPEGTEGFATRVEVGGLDTPLCGRYRPGHFAGVATVVAKLLGAVEPDRLYLGAKDYQQSLVITRMVRDLDLGVRVVVCPTVREADGLAMSSRNSYLTPEERAWAPALYRALRDVAAGIRSGALIGAEETRQALRGRVSGGPGRLQYGEVLSATGLTEVDPLEGRVVLALAYELGRARLIDNLVVAVPERREAARTGSGRSRPGSGRRGGSRKRTGK